MQILRCAKNNKPIDAKIASALIILLELQILALFLVNTSSPIFSYVFSFIETKSSIEPFGILIFAFNVIELLFIVFKIIRYKNLEEKKSLVESSIFLRFLEIKPYLLFVQIININSFCLSSNSKTINVLSAFNIIFCILELSVLKIISISYRFIEKNHIRRKNSSILSWILIIPIIFALNFYDKTYGSIFLLSRAFTQIYFNFNSFENEEIRFYEWFFPLISIEFTFLILVDFYLNMSIFSNFMILTFTILFSIFCCNEVSLNLSVYGLKYHLKNCQNILDSENEETSIKGGSSQINESEMKKMELQLRILVKILMARYKIDSFEKKNNYESDTFDNWWKLYNKFILDHRVYCQNVTCSCSRMQFMKHKENHDIEKILFIDKIYSIIKKLQVESSVAVNKLKIIENYFLIEIEKKPMKTYYQLMKIEKEKLNREETLEIENLIHETRGIFKQLFLKENVQNTELDIEPLFQFQDHLKDMRERLNDMAVQYRQFYEIFASNFVQMQDLKKKTRKLTEFKKQFSHEIDFCLKHFDKSSELMTFCMVYFRFFDEYTNKLEKVEERAQHLIETFRNPLNESKRGIVDIFDPHYGAVKIDLVFKLGRIIIITKNLCQKLGFTHQELSGQKVNKMMPSIFARHHDRILRNFIEKGSMKMLKFKEQIYYARSVSRYLFPVSLKLKVDYTHSDGLYSVAFMRPTITKSEYILMNNYGKIEEITEGIYMKLFGKALGNEVTKVKKLCVSKLLLSLNYLFKDDENANFDQIYEGMILTTEDEKSLMAYYKFPELKKIYKGKAENSGAESSRSTRSVESTYSSGDGSNSLDFSVDMSKYNIDLKESIREYFKNVNIENINGFFITYRFQECVTSEFRFKILEILNVREEISGILLETKLKQEILDISEFIGIEEEEISSFSIMQFASEKEKRNRSVKPTSLLDYEYEESNINHYKEDDKIPKILMNIDSSESGSLKSGNEEKKKKEIIMNSFEESIVINTNLQWALNILIFLMAFILILVCIFSLQLQGKYQNLQDDNMIIRNFRVNFLLRIAVEEMYQVYSTYGLAAPQFLTDKKSDFTYQMKQLLENSIQWIDISWPQYSNLLNMIDSKSGYQETMAMITGLQVIYSTFLMAETRGYYIIDNYISIGNNLSNLVDIENVMILDKSNTYNLQIHYAVAVYSTILVALLVVLIWLRKIALEKEDKVIDFLPFLKAFKAKRMALLYEKFFEYNKEVEDLDEHYVNELSLKIIDCDLEMNAISNEIFQQGFSKLSNNMNQENNDSRLIRVVKNEKSEITIKIVLSALIIIGLCLFVIFYSEYFFNQANRRFNSYNQLKNDAFLVQLIPSRTILLYFINFQKLINNQTMDVYPESFISNVHDRTFEYQRDAATQTFYGTQMEQAITHQFTQNICNLIVCSSDSTATEFIKNEEVFYLSYRYVNAFNYLRKINDLLPNDKDPKTTMKKWIDTNNVFEILSSIDFILDIMKKSQDEIASLFTNQINQIGLILLSLSLTLIPILIVIMMFGKNKFMEFICEKLQCTEHIYKHISWPMLSENTYAANYFENKMRNIKKY